jgi:hypothetical protein
MSRDIAALIDKFEVAEDEAVNFNGADNVLAERYAAPAVVVAALKRAGKIAAFRLLAMLEDERFADLPVKTQLEVLNLALDRAYGKIDSQVQVARVRDAAAANQSDSLSLGKQLDKIEGWTPPEMRKSSGAASRNGRVRPAPPDPFEGGETPSDRSPAVIEGQSLRPASSNVVRLPRSDVPRYGNIPSDEAAE